MKKMYKKPQTAVADYTPVTTLCTSTGSGGSSDNITTPPGEEQINIL